MPGTVLTAVQTKLEVDQGRQQPQVVAGQEQRQLVGVEEAPGQGRHLIATEDVEAGAVLIDEYPIVAGPLYTRSVADRPDILCLKVILTSAPIGAWK